MLHDKSLMRQIRMKRTNRNPEESSLFLEVCNISGAAVLPLHSSITLFLLSYTECESFQVYLVSDQPGSVEALADSLPKKLAVSEVKRAETPALVAACRLPVVVEPNGCFCRAGLAVVLRHIIQMTCRLEPQRRDVASLLGFKNTCLKACAEVRAKAKRTQGLVPYVGQIKNVHLFNKFSFNNTHHPIVVCLFIN